MAFVKFGLIPGSKMFIFTQNYKFKLDHWQTPGTVPFGPDSV